MNASRLTILAVLALVLAGCGDQLRTYRLKLNTVPEGSERKVTGTVQVGGKEEAFDVTAPTEKSWHATSFSADLRSPAPGGLAVILSITPDGAPELRIGKTDEGPAGVRLQVIENPPGTPWGIETRVTPLPAIAAAPAEPASIVVQQPALPAAAPHP